MDVGKRISESEYILRQWADGFEVVKVYRSTEEYHVCMFPYACRTNDPETTARMLIKALEDASDESDLKKH